VNVEGIPESVPAFLRKSYYILASNEFEGCVNWSEDGKTLVISKVS
jgi:hypothetical protein